MAGIRASILLAGALMCAGLAVPAHAQNDEESRAASRKESTRMMLQFAECTARIRKYKPDIDRFLRLSPNDPEFGKMGGTFAKDRCVPPAVGTVTMKFDPILFRYGLFEARYRIEFGKSQPPSMIGLPPLDLDSEFDLPITPDLRGTAALPPLIVFLRQLGDCAMRYKTAEAHAFVLAKPYSDEEGVALQGLMPALGECMPEGQTLKFSRPMLRGTIAEALYKAATYTGPRVAAAPTQSVN